MSFSDTLIVFLTYLLTYKLVICFYVTVCQFAAAPLRPVHFLSPDQESRIHCLIICAIQPLTLEISGET